MSVTGKKEPREERKARSKETRWSFFILCFLDDAETIYFECIPFFSVSSSCSSPRRHVSSKKRTMELAVPITMDS